MVNHQYLAALRFFRISNYLEAALWCLIGLGIASGIVRGATLVGYRRLIAALVLILFGVSDIIEAFTGAWYRPVGLLVLKGLCLAVILWLVAGELRRRQPRR